MAGGKYCCVLIIALCIQLESAQATKSEDYAGNTTTGSSVAATSPSTPGNETTMSTGSTVSGDTPTSPMTTSPVTTANSTEPKPPRTTTQSVRNVTSSNRDVTTANHVTTQSTTPQPNDKFSVEWFFVGVASCLGFIILVVIVTFVVRKKCIRSRGDDQPLLSA